MVLYSYSQAPDACVPLSGASKANVNRIFSFLNSVCGQAEEERAKYLYSNEGDTELDSTRVAGKDAGRNRREHRGRISRMHDRNTSESMHHQLPNKVTIKGPGGGGPETYQEMRDQAIAQTQSLPLIVPKRRSVWPRMILKVHQWQLQTMGGSSSARR